MYGRTLNLKGAGWWVLAEENRELLMENMSASTASKYRYIASAGYVQ